MNFTVNFLQQAGSAVVWGHYIILFQSYTCHHTCLYIF